MKKLLSVVAVIALVFALAVPAFALDVSVTYEDNAVKTDTTVTTDEGETLKVEVSTATVSAEQETKLDAAIEKAVESDSSVNAEDVAVVNVVDVTLTKDGVDVSAEYFEAGNKLTVAFAIDQTTQKVVKVLYWNEKTGVWDEAQFDATADGVNVTFEHLCEVAFVMADVKTDDSVKTDDNNGGTNPTAQKNPGKSPQTGYDVFGWAAAVSALVIAAGYCFVSARKVTE
jgi:hypothetical protein